MIALTIPARSESESRFIARLSDREPASEWDAVLVDRRGERKVYAGRSGLFELTLVDEEIDGDIIAVDPRTGLAERLVRSNSDHNTFLVTERCDQLCVMCSQPPKKTHIDRWDEFRQAALLSPQNKTIGISGGEPTLFKSELFDMLDEVLSLRPDLSFHVLTNGQHFDHCDLVRLSSPAYDKVAWGVPMYSSDTDLHDRIVAKPGAHARLRESLTIMLEAGAHIELRSVVMSSNVAALPDLADYIATHLGFIDQWSIMQLEAIGFAKNRFQDLSIEVERDFPAIGRSIDMAQLFGVPVALFNFPLCSIPSDYRRYGTASISDWKRKYASDCESCSRRADCSGFFAWHPEASMKVTPI